MRFLQTCAFRFSVFLKLTSNWDSEFKLIGPLTAVSVALFWFYAEWDQFSLALGPKTIGAESSPANQYRKGMGILISAVWTLALMRSSDAFGNRIFELIQFVRALGPALQELPAEWRA